LAITPQLILDRAVVNAVIPKTIRATSLLSLEFSLGCVWSKLSGASLGQIFDLQGMEG
jgi:hypothetical protein